MMVRQYLQFIFSFNISLKHLNPLFRLILIHVWLLFRTLYYYELRILSVF